VAGVRRLKTRRAVLEEALARGVATLGGLAKAVYGEPPRKRKARVRVSKLLWEAKFRG
jgi:hypothetical protein